MNEELKETIEKEIRQEEGENGRGKLAGRFLMVLVILGFLATSSSVQAFFEDFWNNFRNPQQEAASDRNEENLYKPVIDYEKAVISAVKKASPAVVSIIISKNVPIIENCAVSPFPPGFEQFFGDLPQITQPCQTRTELREVGGGSGFIVSDNGLILTNKHVVSDTKASYTVFLSDGKKYDAKILARDPVQDLAVIKIEASGLPTVELGDSSSVEPGQTAIAIGYALGEFRNTVSAGVISGLSRTVTASDGSGSAERLEGVIQTDTAINRGNSGGPLLNLKGEVIGVNTAMASGAENIGFAIPINRAKRDIDSVRNFGEIKTPYIGVRYVLITPEIAKQEKLPVEEGALVEKSQEGSAILQNSPAEKAGLKEGDIIVRVDGKKITRDFSLAEAISDRSVGDKIFLTYLRDGKETDAQITLEQRP